MRQHTYTAICTSTFGVLTVALLIVALAMPLYASADHRGNRNDNGRGNAFGHLVAPSITNFSTTFENRIGDLGLPPGILFLLARYGVLDDIIRDDDEDEDEPDEDTTDPSLTNSEVDTDTMSATIGLEFNEEVQARVFVSDESGFDRNDDGVMRQAERDFMSEHEFAFDGLSSDTEYFFRVQFRDEAGNTVLSDEMSFMTEALSDETAPSLLNATATPGTSTVDIDLTFDEEAQVQLHVSDTSGFDPGDAGVMTFTETTFASEHSFAVDGLDPDTEYFYTVEFRDDAGNSDSSGEQSFMTEAEPDTTTPTLVNATATPGTSTADIDLAFDEEVQAEVHVSTTTGFDPSDPGVTTFTETTFMSDHSFSVDGLTPDTEYFYTVEFRDEADNSDISSELSFTTEALPDETAPVISNVASSTGTSSIEVSWDTDEPATSAVHTSTSTGFALTDPGVIVTEDTSLVTDHTLTITGLATSTTYHHRIVSEDEAGNETISGEFTLATE